jgi:transposase
MPTIVKQFRNRLKDKKIGLEVWFQDEARFGLMTTLRRIYAKRGSRPRGMSQIKYKWLYVWGAVNPSTGQSVGMISSGANSDWMNHHLQLISEATTSKHVILVIDQAGWHRSKDLKVPSNITLLLLPPYSPELNPVERVWLHMKTHHTDGIMLDNENQLADRLCQSWNLLNKNTLKSLTGYKWILKAAKQQ